MTRPRPTTPATGGGSGTPFTDRFRRQAERIPRATAASFGDDLLSYEQLAARSRRLALRLRELGAGPEVVVGVVLEASVDLVVAFLAVLESGAALLPLDPDHPPDRLAWMLEDCAAPLAVAPRAGAPALPHGIRGVAPDEEPGAGSSASPAWPAPHPEQLAYVIYTSGSTGRPKGVMVPYRGLSGLCDAQAEIFGLGQGDRVLQFAALSFDAIVYELTMALGAGATLVLAGRDERLPGPHLAALLESTRVTAATLPPSALAAVPDVELPALHTLAVAGERCPADLVRRWARGRRFFNLYGPTEASVWSTFARCEASAEAPPIGTAVPGVVARVLDGRLAESAGGELYLGGAGVARGYAGRPDRTAECFLPDPFSPDPGSRLYRTGDAVGRRDDGALEFVGRLDEQIKLRGHRIEPGEVEAALERQPGVGRAVVLAREEPSGRPRLVGYVVATSTPAPRVEGLRRALERELPRFMVPSALELVDGFPTGHTGKIDRGAMRAPAAGEHRPPATPAEEAVARVLGGLLGVGEVSRSDGFLDLGGDSLLASGAAHALRERLGVEVPLASLFGNVPVSELARLAESPASGGDPDGDPGPVREAATGPQPLGPAQNGVWFLQQLNPASAAYNSQAQVRLRGALDPEALRRALQEIVRRHEIYRTRFPESPLGEPCQVVEAPWTVELPLADLSALAPADAEVELAGIMGRSARRTFDVDALPLARWELVRLGPQDHVLNHVEHHLLHDGWSFNLLLGELLDHYEAFAAGREPRPEEPALQFADVARWQQRWVDTPAAASQVEHWRARLAGAPSAPLPLPLDRPRLAVRSFRGAIERLRLPGPLWSSLERVAREQSCTPFATAFAVLVALLYHYSGRYDLVVGSGFANRSRPELERVLGMLVNTVALRVDASGDPPFRNLLRRVRTTVSDAWANQAVPFDRVVRAVQPKRTLDRNPLFQVLFSFHDSPQPWRAARGLDVEVTEGFDNGTSKFEWNVIVLPRSRGGPGEPVPVVWEYDTALFDRETVATAGADFEAALRHFVADASLPLSSLRGRLALAGR